MAACEPQVSVGSPCQLARDGSFSFVLSLSFLVSSPASLRGFHDHILTLNASLLASPDECQPPSNADELRSALNVGGAICLNQQCYYSDVAVGDTCVVENVNYVTFVAGVMVSDIRSKDK